MPTTPELAYCPGVIDSDGTIGIKKSTYSMRVTRDSTQPSYSERVCVRQVSPEAVELLHALFGGSFGPRKASTPRGKPLYEWAVTDRRAAECLVAVLPWLRIKAAQARNCLSLRDVKNASKVARVAHGRGHAGAAKRSAVASATMDEHYLRAKALNRVGVQGTPS